MKNTVNKKFFDYVGTNPSLGVYINDNNISSYYDVNGGANPCWLGQDFGNLSRFRVTKI
jgi:hypothetical protein